MTMTHGFFVSMGGFVTAKGQVLHPITPHALRSRPDIINGIHEISGDEILDKSKGDEITKGLALIQTAWFIAQCIARLCRGLPLIELEVITLAFSFLNIVIRVIWWHKPLDVRFPIRIGPAIQRSLLSDPPPRREPFAPDWIKAIEFTYNLVLNSAVVMFGGETDEEDIPKNAVRVPTLWAGRLHRRSRGKAAAFAIFLAMSFGAIHCIAWNSSFPTMMERALWRITSVTVTVVPFIFFLDAAFMLNVDVPEWYHDLTWWIVLPLGVCSYVVARGVLMVLSFVALRSLPAEVYTDIDWTSYIPHI
ncbi:hypothetical protein BDZ94DRAFT_1277893 [Collybia nuda]|uniref:Uncharacterized protein n=1 Tax=Collybia nuda TaxID=64659 RepID=A0A9P5XRI1_9AGAR|nr:hypothetical protein BDZ94DRAFT_1277893 [Collybia nuda]